MSSRFSVRRSADAGDGGDRSRPAGARLRGAVDARRERRERRDDEVVRPTPNAVTVAVSIGTAPLPFVAVYAVLFLLHGLVHPVHPPDIGSTPHQETIAGIITAVLFVVGVASLVMFLNRSRRWFYALVQLVVLVASLLDLTGSTIGGKPVAGLLVATTVVSLACAYAPSAWIHLGLRPPRLVLAVYGRLAQLAPTPTQPPPEQAGTGRLPASSDPTVVMPSALRRQHDRMG